ncbi:glycosyltransferase [Bacillus safensis]|uniref:glycosyltransferase family 2 protein n=1 Tax=Bacillus TaxID=1386 RepID=UPI000D028079|nr:MULTISPECIES: glycosyltransferase family 2 protein [Bacillus]MBW4848942.1 glycosyltransferase [Bacillaceae bacterium]MBW4851896.1 glycosyltransferase [Bacillaceae bacterium]MBW4854962.1 glycosyltransferase [Bacillaceae bacterium]MCY7583926.1 glycosyltransferase [Bacillus safensis]MCY7588232.1 glycosyltransferase [Bacillus safensis]
MEHPLLTVVLPVYNVEAYVEECLESIIGQTMGFENIEVILVNDCSTDGTPAILDGYAERFKNIKVIHLKENCGAPGKPRNIGLQNAKGEYIIFADPDDCIPSDAYEKLYGVMKKNNSDFVMGKILSFNEESGKTFEHITFKDYFLQKHYNNVNLEVVPFFLQVKTSACTKMVKSSFLRKHNILFPEGMKNGEDKIYDVALFTNSKNFSYIPEYVYYYRTRNDSNNLSLTQQNIKSTLKNDVIAALKVKNSLNEIEFAYFQINVLRSLLWKICDREFNKVPLAGRLEILEMIRPVVTGFNPDLVGKYFSIEKPFLSLVEKNLLIESLQYNSMIISRRWWYINGTELQKHYEKQQKIKNSLSWRITKIFRSKIKMTKLKYKIKEKLVSD